MKLNRYVLSLFFDSAYGSALVEGFEMLAPREPADLAAPLADDAQDANDAPDDVESEGEEGEEGEDEPGYTAATIARMAIEGCFSERQVAVARTLRERKVTRPTTDAEARALYEALLDEGVGVQGFDVNEDVDSRVRHWEEEAAFDRDMADDDESEEESEDDSDQEEPSSDDPELSEEDDEETPASDDDDGVEFERLDGSSNDQARLWGECIPEISWALHCFAPDQFAPYNFVRNYDRFEAICSEFGIPLPRLPGKAQHRERVLYYLEANQALQEFRKDLELSPAELNAFLYAFALQCIADPEVSELPEAGRAWLLLANPEADFDNLDGAEPSDSFEWQGSEEMRPGDIAVMWCRTPRSSVHSIWRVNARAHFDPFFFYYRSTRITGAIKVPAITFRELSANAVWAKKPAVRAHFQNSSGKEITREEYDTLLEMLAAKGFDIGALPRLEVRDVVIPEGLENERDVEEQLLEPLLQRLRFRPSDWRRQLPLRMGRGDRVYPDYAFGVDGQRGEESARMIVEAKFHITTERALREAYVQARSYGERLRSDVVILCAVEGVWAFSREGGTFEFERRAHWTWQALSAADELEKLAQCIERAQQRKHD